MQFLLLLGFGICSVGNLLGQIPVYVNFDLKHTVGGVSTFEREKWITVHASNYEGSWDGQLDKKNYLLNDLDAYMIRETGLVTDNVSRHTAEAIRNSVGPRWKAQYASKTSIHPFEAKQDLIIANQHRIYEELDANTTAERVAAFLDSFTGTGGVNGMPKPKYFEILNEPLFPFVDFPAPGKSPEPIINIFNYHKDVAIKMKELSPDTKVGGYVAAFLIFEENDFRRWNDRWKLYIDVVGEHTDFYSAHFYDFPGISNGKELYRKGANNEATLDMLEHYTFLVDKERPLVISEYGSQVHDWYGEQWSSFRDWLFLKATNSMMLQFMERPDRIEKALPFTVTKAEWGFGFTGPNIPYPWRMMRQAQEPGRYTPSGYTGEWVWTDYIKFYELWKDVSGTRIDTKPGDLNIQTDGFVNGNKAYVILNSLKSEPTTVVPSLEGFNGNNIESVKLRHLFLGADRNVKLEFKESEYIPNQSFDLGAEATLLVEYTFSKEVAISENSEEKKYYADIYLQRIQQNQALTFNVDGVELAENGEAVLRIGVGRNLGSNLTPKVKVNGINITSNIGYRGDNQEDRPRFFGLLEIDIPYEAIQAKNKIEIEFPDNGGHVSSVALQVFNFSRNVERGENQQSLVLNFQEQKNKVTFFPNPSHRTLQIIGLDIDEYELNVVDLNGRIVQKERIVVDNNGDQSIELKTLSSGVYVIHLKGKKESIYSKLIID